jgi:phage terminase large subunit GpA-like protein
MVQKIGPTISELFNFLKQRKNDDGTTPTGYMHFPEYNTEYFKQLTAEQLVTRIVKGYPKRIWQKTRDRNEALDCRVYARAAAIALGIDRWSESKWLHFGIPTTKIQVEPPEKDNYEGQPYITQERKNISKRPKIIRSSWI